MSTPWVHVVAGGDLVEASPCQAGVMAVQVLAAIGAPEMALVSAEFEPSGSGGVVTVAFEVPRHDCTGFPRTQRGASFECACSARFRVIDGEWVRCP